jgi:hypothetical protein
MYHPTSSMPKHQQTTHLMCCANPTCAIAYVHVHAFTASVLYAMLDGVWCMLRVARLCCAQTEILSGNAAPSNRLASVSLQRTSRYDAMATKIVLDGLSVYGGRVSST